MQRVWEHVMCQHFGHLTVQECTNVVAQDHVEKRRHALLPRPGRQAASTPVAPATVRNERSSPRLQLRFAGAPPTAFDPALIKGFVPEESAPRDRALEDEEVEALFAAAAQRSQKEGKL